MSLYQRIKYSLYLAAVVSALLGLVVSVASADVVGLLPSTAFDLLMSPACMAAILALSFLVAPLVALHAPISDPAAQDMESSTKARSGLTSRTAVLFVAGLLLLILSNLLVYFLS